MAKFPCVFVSNFISLPFIGMRLTGRVRRGKAKKETLSAGLACWLVLVRRSWILHDAVAFKYWGFGCVLWFASELFRRSCRDGAAIALALVQIYPFGYWVSRWHGRKLLSADDIHSKFAHINCELTSSLRAIHINKKSHTCMFSQHKYITQNKCLSRLQPARMLTGRVMSSARGEANVSVGQSIASIALWEIICLTALSMRISFDLLCSVGLFRMCDEILMNLGSRQARCQI